MKCALHVAVLESFIFFQRYFKKNCEKLGIIKAIKVLSPSSSHFLS